MLDAILTYTSIAIALYVGFRMFRRTLQNLWVRVQPFVLSSWDTVRSSFPKQSSQRSYAVERTLEQSGTSLVELLEQASDDELLDALSLARGKDGTHRWADSRIAKFIGGRVEDRVEQVRTTRNKETPPKPTGRVLPIRSREGVQQVAWEK